jgi:hypothetical protein
MKLIGYVVKNRTAPTIILLTVDTVYWVVRTVVHFYMVYDIMADPSGRAV